LQGTVTAVNEYLEQSIGDAGNPAGGIVSNASDMARWLLVQLDSGRMGSNKIVSTAGFRELWKVVTPVPITKVPRGLEPAQPDFMGYALGMRTWNYGRHVVVSHGGKLDGFVSQVVLLPRENIGIAILTNQESTGAYWSVIYKLLDYYLQNPSYNWVAPYVRLMQDSKTEWENEWNKTRIVPAKSTPKPVDLEKYVGVYKDDFYGNITVEKAASGLVFHFHQTPQFTGQLSPLQYDTFTALFRNKNLKADSWMSFSRSPEGTISGLTLKVIDPSSDISFEGLSFKKVKSP
jgi:hypothetical protein